MAWHPWLQGTGASMDTNDLAQVVLLVCGTVGGAVALLFLMAAIEPKPDKHRRQSQRAGQGQNQ